MVDVSIEALKSAKDALSTFLTDIDGIASRSSNDSEMIISECNNHVRQVNSDVLESEKRIEQLCIQIADLNEIIVSASNEYNICLNRITQFGANIQSMTARISSIKSQLSALRSQLGNAEDDERKQQIQAQINALNSQLYQCETERNQFERNLESEKAKKTELECKIDSAKSRKLEKEDELSSERNRCNKLKDKLERLTSALSKIEDDFVAYIDATKEFESNSADKTSSNKNAIERCIQNIEDYLSASL